MKHALACLTVIATVAAAPAMAHADAQWSARQAMGGGAALGDQHHKPIFDLALRSELLFGAPGDEHVRLGPAIELRTATFHTIEPAGGGAILLPTWRGYPIVLSALMGYTWRRGPDSPVFVGTFAWGYRSYNWHGFYGLGLMAYVTARVDVDHPAAYELLFGVEIDLEAMWVIPALALKMLFTHRDPDEPEQ